MTRRSIKVAHSPDTDDVFMFWAIATGRIDTGPRRYELVSGDIEVLNRKALAREYDVTAISFGAYPELADRYALLDSGASVGDGYGPVVVARETVTLDELAGRDVATPGRSTTARLVLLLANPNVRETAIPFKEVGPSVAAGRFAAGVLIHEGQITWDGSGLVRIADLGVWWNEREGLPLPLGANAVARDLGAELCREIARDLRRSIEAAVAQRDDAIAWTMERCPGLDAREASRYLDMYVNDDTVSMPRRVRRAAERLFEAGHEAGILPRRVPVDVVTP